jgi:hypothetical protein
MHSKICGRQTMDLRELVYALLNGDLLAARQWVADARRAGVDWQQVHRPQGLNEREITVAAAFAELLAERSGSLPPAWTAAIGGANEALILDPGLEQMPRSLARARSDGPAPLRRRNLVAPPDFLEVA